ncbi:hypothetical protein INR49_001316, partial [Caranx melampygus]
MKEHNTSRNRTWFGSICALIFMVSFWLKGQEEEHQYSVFCTKATAPSRVRILHGNTPVTMTLSFLSDMAKQLRMVFGISLKESSLFQVSTSGHIQSIKRKMFRKSAWRNTVSDAVSAHQDQALNTTIFLLKSYGPTGFLLKEDGEARNFKVCLGDPHTCTCPVFVKEQEPCKHICWVLLRKFKLPREHEYSFQLGLVERQISEVLHGLHQAKANRMENDSSAASGSPSQPVAGQEAGSVCRKMIQAQDVCPICQEELLEKKLPVSYCRFGCGNNVHISCMKVWADHQRLSDKEETVKCPLCREDFVSLKSLQEQVKNAAKLFTAAERERPDRHLGVLCSSCQISPITGKCFKCMVCSYCYLCEDCKKKGCHPKHQFASRAKRRDQWRLVAEDLSDEPEGAASHPANDINFLVVADRIPESVLGCLPSVRVRSGSLLLDEGQQCRLCLQSFTLGQRLRTLPCKHKAPRGRGTSGLTVLLSAGCSSGPALAAAQVLLLAVPPPSAVVWQGGGPDRRPVPLRLADVLLRLVHVHPGVQA